MFDPVHYTRSLIILNLITTSPFLYLAEATCQKGSFMLDGSCQKCNATCVDGCPPGFALETTCSLLRDCACKACTSGFYQSYANFPSHKCFSCKEKEMEGPVGTFLEGCGGVHAGSFKRCESKPKPLHFFVESCTQVACTLTAPANHYLQASCSEESDAVFAPCSKCQSGKYKIAPCTNETDTLCENIPEGFYFSSIEDSLRECSTCASNEFEERPCTDEQDAACVAQATPALESHWLVIGIAFLILVGVYISYAARFKLYSRGVYGEDAKTPQRTKLAKPHSNSKPKNAENV